MQITDLAQEQKIPALWRLGFRPFFLFASVFAVVAITIWQLILAGKLSLTPYGGGYWWHIHEMLFGFVMPIVAGFLLTAAQNWTGIRGAYGKTLQGLFILWLLPRILLLIPTLAPQWLIIIADLAFLPAVAFTLAKPIIAIKQYRNLFFIPLLALFTGFNVLMHLSLVTAQPLNITIISYSCILLVCVLISVMAGRVTPMFTANGTQTEKVVGLPLLEKITNGSLLLLSLVMLLSAFFTISPKLLAALFFIAGISQFVRWFRWMPWITLPVPLLWSLHGAIKFIWFGLICLGFCYLYPELPKNHFWHLITIGGIGGIILAMMARVSLGHTGRVLQVSAWVALAFILLSVAALIRTFGPWLMPEFTLFFYAGSSMLWIFAFILFLIKYAPMFCQPRVDGRPG